MNENKAGALVSSRHAFKVFFLSSFG